MSDLNKKNINYGALNRFYQNLKNKDLNGLATEQYVDNAIANIPQYVAGEGIAIDSANTISCTVKPITNVSVLPDAEANKDSVLRLEGDKKVYLSKYNSNNAPDTQQVGVAYVTNDSNDKFYYSGVGITIIANNGTFNGYAWLAEGVDIEHLDDGYRISVVKANEILDNTALFYVTSDSGTISFVEGTTFTTNDNIEETPISNMDMLGGYYIKPVGYEWRRVVTEDELDGIVDTFQALEARIYALEHQNA